MISKLAQEAAKTPALNTFGRGFKSPHKRTLNWAIKKNFGGGEQKVRIRYKKKDGTLVERTIRPLGARKGVLVAHDYDRNDYRSFTLGNIESLSKTAYAKGFLATAKKKFWRSRIGKKVTETYLKKKMGFNPPGLAEIITRVKGR